MQIDAQSTPNIVLLSVSQEALAGAVSRGLQRRYGGMRNAAKVIARALGIDYRTAGKLLCGASVPSSTGLVNMMAEVTEVREEILRLAGQTDAAEQARLAAALDQITKTINSLKDGGGDKRDEHRPGVSLRLAWLRS